MRTGAAADHTGYFHETAFYGSDDEFVAIVGPFLRDGVAAGEPTIVACAPANTALLREAVDCTGVRFLAGSGRYVRPGPTIHAYRSMFGDLVAAGADQIRVVGDVPHPGVGMDWHGWARYEAAINIAYDEFPLWGLCPYDTRTAPASVLDDVACTHPHVASASGHHHSDRYLDPASFLDARSPPPVDPVELTEPHTIVLDPDPRSARAALHEAGVERVLGVTGAANLALATSEAVTNALVHGRPPTTLRLWVSDDRVITTVTDRGPGPSDPFVGLVPAPTDQPGGRGLWIANQVCSDVAAFHGDGFRLRLTVTAGEDAP